MVTCPRCHTGNLLDSEFCRKCGAGLPEDAREAARARQSETLAEADRLLAAGDAGAALALATGTLDTDPDSPRALTLAMEAHLKRGEKAAALTYADRLVELSPDSELDRLRRDYLRESLERGSSLPDAAQRRYAVVAGVSAMVFLAGIGYFFSTATRPNPTVPSGAVATTAPVTPTGFGTGPATTQTPAEPNRTEPTQEPEARPNPTPPPATTTTTPGPGDVPPVRDETPRPTATPPRPVPGVAPSGPALSPGGGLPPASGEEEPVAPVVPPVAPSNSVDPAPRPQATRPTPKPSAGTIEIEVSQRRPSSGGAGGGAAPATPSAAGGSRAYTEIGLQKFQTGDLPGAAAAFEQALTAGGDPVSLNQRLAQTYSRLGRRGDAAAAYRRAIVAIDSALGAGKGDRGRLERVRETCQSALAALGG